MSNITAVCPSCKQSYQLKSSLQGQKLRCPNRSCRTLFIVGQEDQTDGKQSQASNQPPDPAPTRKTPEAGQGSGTFVGEMIPLLSSDAVAPEEGSPPPSDDPPQSPAEPTEDTVGGIPVLEAEPVPPEPQEDPSTHKAPPPVRSSEPEAVLPEEVFEEPRPGSARQPSNASPPTNPLPETRFAPTAAPASAPSQPPAEPPKASSPGTMEWKSPPGPVAPPARDPGKSSADGPRDLPPGSWEGAPPPPRRRRENAPDGGIALAEAPSSAEGTGLVDEPLEVIHEEDHPLPEPGAYTLAEPAPEPVSRGRDRGPASARWTRRIILGALLLLCLGMGAGAWWVYLVWADREEKIAQDALQFYADGQFAAAESKFLHLINNFPESEEVERYRFLQALSVLRAQARTSDVGPGPVLDQIEAFLVAHRGNPGLKEHQADIGQALMEVVKSFDAQQQSPTGTEPRQVVGRVREVANKVKGLGKDALPRPAETTIEATLTEVLARVRSREQRERALGTIERLAIEKPPADALRAIRQLLKEEQQRFPDLESAARVEKVLASLYKGHLARVVYTPKGFDAQKPNHHPQVGTSVLFDPRLAGAPVTRSRKRSVYLALVRGVLYGLDRTDGVVHWAVRVGIDTTNLPIRVPRTLENPERILVLSADNETLTALDAHGIPLWVYQLSAPCLSRPVIVGNRVLIPTYDGYVYEVELSQGANVGRWVLGQRLTVGGVLEPETSLVYIPADDSCVYVLDVKEKKCQQILYTGHRSGSLRGAPVIIPRQNVPGTGGAGGRPGYMILTQADGLTGVELKVYELPLRDRHTSPIQLPTPARVPGWTWFPPFHDGEKLVVLSDTARLGLFGIKQALNEDPPLFPLLKSEAVDLSRFLPGKVGSSSRTRSRAQVVQAQGNDFWVLASGQLQRLQMGWAGTEGRSMIPGWPRSLPLGSPLHRAQRDYNEVIGQSTLFVVTQHLQQQTCLATAVDDESGRVLWQRQLGMICQGNPVSLRSGPLHQPVVVLPDVGGALFALDPSHFKPDARGAWQSDGQRVLLSRGLDKAVDGDPVLLAAPDGRTAYQVASLENGSELLVRQLNLDDAGSLAQTEHRVKLGVKLAGQPVLMGSWLILPLRNGRVRRLRVPIPEEVAFEEGPDWRALRVGPDVPGYVVALDANRFLMSDGARGLTTVQWGQDAASWRRLVDTEDVGLEVSSRIIGQPVLLPTQGPGTLPHVCVADSDRGVTLVEVRPNGSLVQRQRWTFTDAVTAGPFAHLMGGSVRVGCVVGGSQLKWLDPDKKDPLWTHIPAGDEGIVGEPNLIDGLLVVADESGRFVGLDPSTGKPVGPGHVSPGSTVATVSPVGFGPGRMLASLSDGTALILNVDRLRAEKK